MTNLSSYVNTKSISKDGGVSTFRSSVVVNSKAKHSKSAVSCQSLMLDDISRSDTIPAILKTLGAKKTHQVLVGFAAETQNLLANAREKVVKKNLDMIVANDVTAAGAGFNSDTNIVKFLYANGDVCELEQMPKVDVANRILDEALRIRRERA